MQQCYDHQHWSAVLWYKDWCRLCQNKLEYHQISGGDVWPHSAVWTRAWKKVQSLRLVLSLIQIAFLCVSCWNKNKLVTKHQLHTRPLGRLQRSKTRMNVWSWGLQPYNSDVVWRKEINSTYRFFLWKYLHLYFVTHNWGWVVLGTSLQKSQTLPD